MPKGIAFFLEEYCELMGVTEIAGKTGKKSEMIKQDILTTNNNLNYTDLAYKTNSHSLSPQSINTKSLLRSHNAIL